VKHIPLPAQALSASEFFCAKLPVELRQLRKVSCGGGRSLFIPCPCESGAIKSHLTPKKAIKSHFSIGREAS
jgi:hypothetical protein